MKVIFSKDKCIDCGVCTGLCEVKALTLTSDWSLKFDEEKCTNCKICVSGCPVRALK